MVEDGVNQEPGGQIVCDIVTRLSQLVIPSSFVIDY
jgi:hypothetical protein